MLQAIKIRIYPDGNQISLLNKLFGCYRFTYNHCLVYKQENYEKDKTSISVKDLSKYFHAKLFKEFEFLREFNSNILKNSIQVLDKTYQSFFKQHTGYPSFKSKHDKQSIKFIKNNSISRHNLDDGLINLTKNLKGIKFKTSEKYEKYLLENKENIKSITVSRNKSDVYHASILFDADKKILNKNINKPINNIVGVDLGVKTFVVCSNGLSFENLNLNKKQSKRIKRLQRQLSKKEKGSKNRRKARIKLAKLYEKINNKKLNYIHNITTQLVRDNQTIVIEDLNVNGMLKNHNLAKSIQDVSWYEVKRQLEYKTQWYGRDLVKISRWFPSSKLCSKCGYINKKIALKDREWICPDCGTHHDRDFNASVNIENEGKRILVGMWNPEFKLVDCPPMDDINSSNTNALKSSGSVKQEQQKSLLTTSF